ncbi:MAG TPA: hypothetical protein VLE89_05665 [Chlamydiales bacterium]|nr:hypothetical protein [Chlamydiales bacterium]
MLKSILRLNKTLIILLAASGLNAQQTGAAAENSNKVAKGNEWPNWVFAATTVFTATAGIILVTIHDGKNAH